MCILTGKIKVIHAIPILVIAVAIAAVLGSLFISIPMADVKKYFSENGETARGWLEVITSIFSVSVSGLAVCLVSKTLTETRKQVGIAQGALHISESLAAPKLKTTISAQSFINDNQLIVRIYNSGSTVAKDVLCRTTILKKSDEFEDELYTEEKDFSIIDANKMEDGAIICVMQHAKLEDIERNLISVWVSLSYKPEFSEARENISLEWLIDKKNSAELGLKRVILDSTQVTQPKSANDTGRSA